ncbi:SGNH/GDSL hydrolase family protein [Streptomyces sp. NPDC006632]|uniref:SGNH/GDSL hydrolase family protein n=1 Tax=Streptomyces sp. NPDC006632 TaxID=3157182 RepID=UPI0033BB7B2D
MAVLVTAMAAGALTGGLLQAPPVVAAPKATPSAAPRPTPVPPGQVEDPDKKLGRDWKSSADRAVTAAADRDGLDVLVADSGDAYAWKTAATLSEPGVPADSWIGNQCLMDHEHAAVVYAPRTFTNKPDLMQGGAFTAIVDLSTGHVTKLPFTASLAYFDPSCNTATHTAAFTGYRDMNDPAHTLTRVITVDTAGRTTGTAAAKGEITSAVPVKDGAVAGLGKHLVHLDRSGRVKNLADADSVPFDIRPEADGKVAFVDRTGDAAVTAKVFAGGAATVLASGKLRDLDLMQGEAGQVFLAGHPTTVRATAGTGVTRIDAPAETDVSSHGRLAVEPVLTPGVRAGLAHIKDAGKSFDAADEPAPQAAGASDDDEPVTVTSTATTTGTKLTQSVKDRIADGSGTIPSPALGITPAAKSATPGAAPRTATTTAAAAAGPANDPTDPDRWCSVSRNDVGMQALQPTPNQVEWAVDMAVRGQLRGTYLRQGGYRDQAGMGTVDPQALFPPPTLTGGGRIPANVLLGIMAQESNLWQADSGAIPGQMSSPLAAVDGYYGHKADPDNPTAYWKINWDKSDCGYGVGQVTDGMRSYEHKKDGEVVLAPGLQKLVAVDYATNVAASMQILADKWNEVHKDGQKVTVNNDDPSMVENWFTAVWNYNLGFNPPSQASEPDHGGNWGLGWFNNPANPVYKNSWGHPFMNTDVDGPDANKDAANPQWWPYEEKVMGWAAWSIDTGFSYATSGRQDWPGETGYASAGFRPAWWTTNTDRVNVQPQPSVFCNTKNNCDADAPPKCPDAACYAKFWWNQPNVSWKAQCATTCGHEAIKYQTLVAEPGRGTRLQTGMPDCSSAPAGAKVVASVPNGTPVWGDGSSAWAGCGSTVGSAGSFQFSFNADSQNHYEAKADLHQIGGGYGGHFWYTHTRDGYHMGGPGNYMTVNGTWTLGQSLNWARVLVHLPDSGAQTRQAAYTVLNSDSKSPTRKVAQRGDRWVSLGVFHFTGTPQVNLSNTTDDGTADEDVAWGAVAFQPLPGKPANSLVVMGDSYTSGEGASAAGGADFYPETDHFDKQNETEIDKCHRSKLAWSRQATLPTYTQSIGTLDDNLDPRLDYHLVACSGARHFDIIAQDQMGEGTQIDTGYLDQNTTLVSLSIGGNDARFTDVFKQCALLAGLDVCQNTSIGNKDPDTGRSVPGDTGPLKDWAPTWLHEEIRPRIAKTLTAIHDRAPYAKIILMGYPELLSADGQCVPGIGSEEAPWLNQLADTLNKEMEGATADADAASGANATFADPRGEFDKKAVCGDPEQVNGLVKTGLSKADNFGLTEVGMASFHPKIGGARLYANVFQAALR